MIAVMFLVTDSVSPHATGVIVQTGSSLRTHPNNVMTQAVSAPMISTQILSPFVWVQQQDMWYCLDSYGQIQTGWVDENGVWYYLNSDGVMQTGWLNENGNWYYLNPDGVMQTEWLNQNENWYYLNLDGAMQTGWLNQNGNWYYLNSDGAMQTGWLNQNGIWYYLYDDGSMAADAWIDSEYVDRNGIWIERQASSQIEQQIPSQVEQQIPSQEQQSPNQESNIFISEETENPTEETSDGTEDIILGYIKERIESLKEKYPDGMYWNHMGYAARQRNTNYYSETVTSIPCNHALYGTSYCNSYINYSVDYVIGVQCDGFARKLSDEIFDANAEKTDYSYNFDAIKVGDYIRYNDSHTVLVIEKDEDSIQVAECNIGGTCVIHWGRRITRSELDNCRKVTCFTRY